LTKKDYEKAIEDFDENVRCEPHEPSAYKIRGEAGMTQRQYDHAINNFTQAIALDPDYGFYYFRRGEAWCLKNEFNKAIQDFERAIGCGGEWAFEYIKLAWLLATCSEDKIRDGKRAIQLVTKACELEDRRGWKQYQNLHVLAAACAEAGQFDEAAHWQSEALKMLHGSLEERRERLERLKLYKQKYLPRLEKDRIDQEEICGNLEASIEKDVELYNKFRERLELYKQKKPYREKP
jgi:tetratricopeptide (TPR) repeat protein